MKWDLIEKVVPLRRRVMHKSTMTLFDSSLSCWYLSAGFELDSDDSAIHRCSGLRSEYLTILSRCLLPPLPVGCEWDRTDKLMQDGLHWKINTFIILFTKWAVDWEHRIWMNWYMVVGQSLWGDSQWIKIWSNNSVVLASLDRWCEKILAAKNAID